jgi:hypothetical protein
MHYKLIVQQWSEILGSSGLSTMKEQDGPRHENHKSKIENLKRPMTR